MGDTLFYLELFSKMVYEDMMSSFTQQTQLLYFYEQWSESNLLHQFDDFYGPRDDSWEIGY